MKCKVWSVKCKVWTVKWKNTECKVSIVKRGVCSTKRRV